MATEIRNPRKYVDSANFTGALMTYPNGTTALTDIDGFQERFGFCSFLETKEFYNNEIRIPLGQYAAYLQLNNQLKRSMFYIVATDDFRRCRPDDIIYYTTLDLIQQKKCLINQCPDTYIDKSQFLPITIKDFNKFCDGITARYANPFLNIKNHTDYPSLEKSAAL